MALNNLGAVLFFEERYAEAVKCYREALTIDRQTLGDRHPAVAQHN